MRLISRKTPILVAGGAVLGRKISRARAARRRKSMGPRIALAGVLGAVGAGIAYATKSQRRRRRFDAEDITSPDGPIEETAIKKAASKS